MQRLFTGRHNSSTHHCSGYLPHSPSTSYIPHNKRVGLHEDGFSNHCCYGVITWFITWPLLSFYAPKYLLLSTPQWNNCQYPLQSMSHNAQIIMRKRKLGHWLTALSHVHCHTRLPSDVKSCHIIKSWHEWKKQINKYINQAYGDFLDTQNGYTTPIPDDGEQVPTPSERRSLFTQLTANEDVMVSNLIRDLGFEIKILHCYDHYRITLKIPGIVSSKILKNHYFKSQT